ncbi:MAG: hypothetical protein RIC16_01700 [Rhodospirillales bacterium]
MSASVNRTPVAVRISLPPERGGQDGMVRAAREMLAVAAHMPGFIFHEPVEAGDTVIAFDLYWTDVASVDTWRERLYQSGLKKYSPEAWQTFEGMHVLQGRTLRPADVEAASMQGTEGPVQTKAQGLWEAFGLSKKHDAA